MQARRKAICRLETANNGITKLLFTTPDDGTHLEQNAWLNWALEPGEVFVEGKQYWITIEPAFPH